MLNGILLGGDVLLHDGGHGAVLGQLLQRAIDSLQQSGVVLVHADGVVLTGVLGVQNGQVDCVIIDSAPAQAFVEANAGLPILDTEHTSEDYAIGMNKDNTALLEAVNGALKELTEDGTIPAIVEKYIPTK